MLTIVIQAGGESQRMGRDKALSPFLGVALIQRVIQRVAHMADELIITSNTPENYAFLDIPTVKDLIPGRGALGGLYTALASSNEPLVAVIACDMPFANPKLLAAERDILTRTDYGAVIPETNSGTEPFHAVYRKNACLQAIKAAISADLWRVDSWFHEVKIYRMVIEEVVIYDPEQLAFQNVNTPDEFRKAEEIARQID